MPSPSRSILTRHGTAESRSCNREESKDGDWCETRSHHSLAHLLDYDRNDASRHLVLLYISHGCCYAPHVYAVTCQ